jgi:hypothetical protein
MARDAHRPPLTAGQIIDAAVELTAQRGLDAWSQRDLASALGTWPNTIAHHTGDRGTLLRLVVDRVVAMMPLPAASLGWQDWFRAVLYPSRPIARRHRGVARHIVRYGPVVPSALPVIDRGIGVLTAGGFGSQATVAYRYLFNSAFSLIAIEDDRDAYQPAPLRVLDGLDAREHPGLAVAAADIAARQAAGPESDADAFYEFTVERALAGVAALLPGEALPPGPR